MPDSVTFDHYEVLTRDDGSLFELGRGAMGITYKALDTNLGMPVALKVISGNFLHSEVARQRFIREARSAAKLRHRHVASVFHLGTEGDAYFYAMELIDGETVDALIKRQGPLKPALALQIAGQVARALNAAQPHGLVHRDIKPANLMLVREDDEVVVKVIDFGLAKSSTAGEEESATVSMGGFVGTPHFASPEQLEEKEIDVRSDIYSLGVTLWYMLAGQTPFAGSMAQVMSQHLSKPPPFERIDKLPAPVATLLRRMLEKDPALRQQTPVELRKEIEQCLAQLGDAEAATADGLSDEDLATMFEDSAAASGETQFELASTVAGRYRITAALGESNTGRAFRADDLKAQRAVRLLVLHRELVEDRAAYTQIEREVERVAPVQHPNLLQVHALETVGDSSFLVLEWTEGFSLLELLRARRELNADEVLRLLPQAADGIDHALSAGLKRLDLGLHQVFVHFAAAPVEREALLRQPVESWPGFVLKLNPLGITRELSLSETWAGAQTMVGGMSMPGMEAPDARARCIQALGAICYELLGGTLSPLAFGTPGSPRYTPLATLTEEGNNVLRRALDPAVSFPTAYEFYQTLNGLDGLEAKRFETKASTVAPRTTAPSPPPPPAPRAAPRQKFPVAFFSGLATVGLIAAVIYIISQEEAPKPLDDGNPAAEQPMEQEEDSPPITPGAESLTLASEREMEEPATPSPPTRQELLRTASAAAEALENESKWPEAVAAWVQIAKDYPDYEKGKAQLELVISHLRERPAAENAKEFPALREPVTAAAELEVRSAMVFLGEMLRRTEPEAAFKWFDAAALKGDLAALTQVGLMYSNGHGVEADLNKAIEAFRAGSEKGHPAAKTALAECYLMGKNVPKDEATGVELLKEAVESKHPRAMDLLGTCYHDGIGVKADYGEAFRLYNEAVELGYLDSLGNLGVLYVKGHGVRRNPAKAVELFKRGAEAGNAACMFFYAQCFESGVGVGQKNLLQAQSWYRQAAEAGNPLAAAWCKENGVPFKVR